MIDQIAMGHSNGRTDGTEQLETLPDAHSIRGEYSSIRTRWTCSIECRRSDGFDTNPIFASHPLIRTRGWAGIRLSES